MAQVHGHICDHCEVFKRTPVDESLDTLPDGWIKVILPGTAHDVREHGKERSFCSGSCLAEFAIERAGADNDATTTVKAAA